jgi:hypothetical protein
MGPEGSLPCSQDLTAGPCPESDESSPDSTTHFLLRFILILSSHLRLGVPSGYFGFSDLNFVLISHISRVCYMLRPSYPP